MILQEAMNPLIQIKCETKSAIQMFLEDSEESNIVGKFGFGFCFALQRWGNRKWKVG